MLLDLNSLSDDLLEEALTTGQMTLQNGTIYILRTSDILKVISFIKRTRPVSDRRAKQSLLPDDFNLDHLLNITTPPLKDNQKPLDDLL